MPRVAESVRRQAGEPYDTPPGGVKAGAPLDRESGSGRGRVHIPRPGGARPVLGWNLAAGVQVGAAHRLHVGAEDGFAVGARPLVRRPDGVERTLEAGHDIAGEQLVAPERLLPVRPLVGTEEEPA